MKQILHNGYSQMDILTDYVHVHRNDKNIDILKDVSNN